MKKSLIAMAVLAASGASFAQSSVTISGAFDPSMANQKTTYGNNSAVSQNTVLNNVQGTSNVTFSGVEDLGGGLKASFLLENDFDTAKDGTSNFGSKGGQQYTAIEGGFGKVALGAPNTPSLTTQTSANPFGTKIGGGFGAMNRGNVRNNNTVIYSSPAISGFSAAVAYSNQTKSTTAGYVGQVSTGAINDIGLFYANGPVAAGVSMVTIAAAPGAVATVSQTRNSETNAYVTYDFGVAKIGAGYYTEKQDVTGAVSATPSTGVIVAKINSSAFNLSAAVPLNASLYLYANYAKKNDKTSLNLDRTVAAIGLKYSLSKRSSVYARIVNDNIVNATAAGANYAYAAKVQTTAVGIMHTF